MVSASSDGKAPPERSRSSTWVRVESDNAYPNLVNASR